MTNEGEFPKANGDVFYSSEMNKGYYFGYGQGIFGNGADGALHVTSGTTTISTQLKRYTSLIVDAGTTLTFSGFGKYYVFVQGDMTINGAITIPSRAGSAPTTFDAVAPTTPTGGAAIIPIGRIIGNIFSYPAEAASGKAGSSDANNTRGRGGGGGGSDGAGGDAGAGDAVTLTGAAGGDGKATVFFFVGGTISYGSASSIAGTGVAGANGGAGGLYGGQGGGGGGGGANIYTLCGKGIAIAAGCTISLSGGKGGNGYNAITNGGAGGGGGGGGSWRAICSGTYSNAGTIAVAGGVGGTAGTGTGPNGTDGTAGGNGTSEGYSIQMTIS